MNICKLRIAKRHARVKQRADQKIFLKGSVLHVQIDSSVAREELAKGKQIIIDRLNDYAGKKMVTDLWFS